MRPFPHRRRVTLRWLGFALCLALSCLFATRLRGQTAIYWNGKMGAADWHQGYDAEDESSTPTWVSTSTGYGIPAPAYPDSNTVAHFVNRSSRNQLGGNSTLASLITLSSDAVARGLVFDRGIDLLGSSARLSVGSDGIVLNSDWAYLALNTLELTASQTFNVAAGNSGLTVEGVVTASSPVTLTVDAGSPVTFNYGGLTGGVTLVKNGAEALTVYGRFDPTGSVTVNGGLLDITLDSSYTPTFTVANSFSLASGTTLQLTAYYDPIQLTGTISGAGTLKLRSDTVISGTNSHSGGTVIGNESVTGPVVTFNAAANFGTGPITLSNAELVWAGGNTADISDLFTSFTGDSVVFNTNGNDVTFATGLAGDAFLFKGGAGTLTLTGNGTHTGNFRAYEGTLQIGNGGTSGSLASAEIQVYSGTTLAFNRSDPHTHAGTITNSGTLAQNGAGTLTLTGISDITNVAVNAGGLHLAAPGGSYLGADGTISVASGTVLSLGANNQIADSATLALAGGTFRLNGYTDSLGYLTQSASSTIDFLGAGGQVSFIGNTPLQPWFSPVGSLGTLTGTLTVANWAGSLSGNGAEQFIVYSPGGAPSLTAFAFTGWGAPAAIARPDLGTDFYEIVGTSSTNEWNIDSAATQLWGNAAGWSAGTVPDGASAHAVLGDTAGSAPLDNNVTLSLESTNRTLNKLTFENSADRSYTVGAGTAGRLDFDASSGNAQIIVNDDGAHTLAADSQVRSGLLVTNGSSATAGLTLAGDLELRSADDLTFNGTGTTVVTGDIMQGTLSTELVKSGPGTLTLAGTASHTGGTTVDAGTLNVTGTLNNGLVQNAGTTSVTGTLNGGVTAHGGTVNIGTGGTAGILTGSAVVNSGATVVFNRSDDTTAGNAISGSGMLEKAGAGTLTLTGTNTISGGTFVNAGTLRAGSATGLSVTSAYTVASGATLELNGYDLSAAGLNGSGDVSLGAGNLAITNGGFHAGVISGAGALTKSGSGTQQLLGASTYTGGTTVTGGLLWFENGANLGTGSVTLDGGGLRWVTGSSHDISNRLNALGAGGATFDTNGNNIAFGTALSGTGALIKAGSGTLTLASANSHSGGTTINGGTILFDGLATFGSGNITLNGGGLKWASGNTTDVTQSGRLNALGSAGGIFDTNGNNVTLTGVIAGIGPLIKSGGGTLTISAANTAVNSSSGVGAWVTGGTLQVGTGGTTGSFAGDATIDPGATLAFNRGNNATFAGDTNGGGTLAQTGSGTLTLTGASLGHAQTNVESGSLVLGDAGATMTVSGGIALNSGQNLSVDSASATTIEGVISGAAGLDKQGAGTLTLTGVNTFTGTTTITSGALVTGDGRLASGSSMSVLSPATWTTGTQTIAGLTGTGTVSIGAGKQLTLDLTGSATFGGQLTGAGFVFKEGAGALTLGGYQDVAGFWVKNGSLTTSSLVPTVEIALSPGATWNTGTQTVKRLDFSGGTVAMASGSTLTVNSTVSSNFGGSITGSASLVKDGAQTFTLAGNSNYTGTTTVNAGTLRLSGSTADNILPSGTALTVAAGATFNQNHRQLTVGSLAGAGTVTLGDGDLVLGGTGASTAYSGTMSGSSVSSLTKAGAGTFTLSGAVGIGDLIVGAGTVAFGANNVLQSGTSVTVAAGATLDSTDRNLTVGGLSGAGTVLAGNGTLTVGDGDASSAFTGTATGSGYFVKAGNGTFTASNLGGITGPVAVNGGTLQLGGDNVLSNDTTVTVASGATLDLAGNADIVGALAGAGTVNLGSGGSLSAGVSGAATTFSGTLTGAGSFTKTGTATMTVTGTSNDYTGGTTISNGQLVLGANNVLPDVGAVTVNGSLDMSNRTETIGGLAGAGTVDLGATGTLTVNSSTNTAFSGAIEGTSGGSLTKAGNGTLTLTGGAGSNFLNGTTVAGGLINFNSLAVFGLGNITLNGGGLQWAAGTTTDVSARLGPVGAGGATFHTNGNIVTLASTLSGSGGLTKAGAGTLTLTGATYTGATAITGGTLKGALPTGTTVSIDSGAALDLTNRGQSIATLSGNGSVLLGGGTLTISGSANSTFGGGIFNSGGVVNKTGSGTLTLTGTSSFDGGFNATAGTVEFAGPFSLGTGTVSLSGATLRWAAGNTTDLSGQLSFDNAGFFASPVTLDTNGNNVTFGYSPLGDIYSLTKAGGGTLTLAGVMSLPFGGGSAKNYYDGATLLGTESFDSARDLVVSGGMLEFSDRSNFGGAELTLSGGGLRWAAGNTAGFFRQLRLTDDSTLDTNGNDVVLRSILSGGHTLTKAGSGTLTLSPTTFTQIGSSSTWEAQPDLGGTDNNENFLGGLNVTGGWVAFRRLSDFNDTLGANALALNGGGLQWLAGNTADVSLYLAPLGASGAFFDTGSTQVTFGAPLTGPGGFTLTNGTLRLEAGSSYSGGTTVSSGAELVLVDQHALPAGSAVTLSGTLTVAQDSIQRAGALVGSGTVALETGTTLTVGGANTSHTFDGAIEGPGIFGKSGSGTLTLTGSSPDFSGVLGVDEGTLRAGASNFLNADVILSVASGGTFDLNGKTLQVGSLQGSGALQLNTGMLEVGRNGASTTYAGAITGGGTLVFDAADSNQTLTLTYASNAMSRISIVNGTVRAGTAGALGGSSGQLYFDSPTAGGVFSPTASFTSTGTWEFTSGNLGSVAPGSGIVLTHTGLITGAGDLRKTGAGILALGGTAGANNYAGSTRIENGTLTLLANGQLPDGSVVYLKPTNGISGPGPGILQLASGAQETVAEVIGGGTISLSSGANLTVTAAGAYSSAALAISGAGSMTASGSAANVDFYGNQVFSGGLTVHNGADVWLEAIDSAGTGQITLDGGKLSYGGSGDLSARLAPLGAGGGTLFNGTSWAFYSGLSGAGGLTKDGPGTLTLVGISTYGGGTTVKDGTLVLAGLNAVPGTSDINVHDGATLRLQGSHTLAGLSGNGTLQLDASLAGDRIIVGNENRNGVFGGTITEIAPGTASVVLEKTGSGYLEITSAQSYTGSTLVSGGALTLTGAGDLSGPVVVGGSARLVFNKASAATFSQAISGAGEVINSNTGTVTLAAANTYTGGTRIENGALAIAGDNRLGAASGALMLHNGTLTTLDSFTSARTLNLQGLTSTLNVQSGHTLTWTGAINEIGTTNGLRKIGDGVLQLGGSGAPKATIEAGTIRLSSNQAFAANSSVTVGSGAYLDLNNRTQTLRELNGQGTVMTGVNSALTLQGSTGGYAFQGGFTGAGNISVGSASYVVFSGNSSAFTGSTTVASGVLDLTGSHGGTVAVSSGATLSGTGTVGALTLNDGSFLSPGASPGTLNAANTTWAGGATYLWEINNATGTAGTGWDLLNITGALAITATSANPFRLDLTSLTLANAAGPAANFNAAQNHTFLIASASLGVTGFDTSAFTIDTADFANPFGGSWSVALAGNNVMLNYTASAIPEAPSYAALAGLVVFALGLWRRRRPG